MRKVISSAAPKKWRSAALIAATFLYAATASAAPPHALALYGEPKYPSDFKQLSYVSDAAVKGGNVNLAVVGSFDSLNPFIVRGLPAAGLGLMYQTLLEKTLDEPQTGYGLLAESVEVAEDRSWVRFTLRPEAVWSDGTPVSAEDVIWSFNTLMKQGAPFYRTYYAHVAKAEVISPRIVQFTFKGADNRELPLILGDMPVLPKAYWTAPRRDFSKTTLEVPMGSGPYKIKSVEAGRRIVFERVANWWAADLPINKGRYNFDTITFDYYRDGDVAFQAFLSGAVDFRQENVAKNWAQGYNHPNVTSGRIKREEIVHDLPAGMQAFVYNLRRPIFSDARVREALGYAFDFEWSNKQLAFGSYTRTNSYFANSPLAATQMPNAEELKLLEPFRAQLPSRVFTDVYQPPRTNGSGDNRENLRVAKKLLEEAGWKLDGGVLKNDKGEAFKFEILYDGNMFDRWILPFIANLKKLGIAANLRIIDVAQYQNRMNDFDFDMTVSSFGQSLTPGNEQSAYWGSEGADQPGGMNMMGIKNPVIDALAADIVKAKTYDELTTITHALDRTLLWNFYVIPQWYVGTFRIAYASTLGRPTVNPPYGLPMIDTWWKKVTK